MNACGDSFVLQAKQTTSLVLLLHFSNARRPSGVTADSPRVQSLLQVLNIDHLAEKGEGRTDSLLLWLSLLGRSAELKSTMAETTKQQAQAI